MLRRSLLPLLTGFLIVACSDATGVNDSVAGDWRLQTVDGLQLPFTLTQNDVDRLELTGESMTLFASGRFTMVTTFRVTDGSSVFPESIPDEGTYTVSGSSVTFRFNSDSSTVTAAVNGNAMTLHDIGLTFLYRRE